MKTLVAKKEDELEDFISEAKKYGSVSIPSEDGEYFLIAPRLLEDTTPSPFENSAHLLEQPAARAAYSDRTAWLMAVLSSLAYVKFEGDDKEAKINMAGLIATLAGGGFGDIDFFNCDKTGTEAFIAVRENGMAVLAFRGTEKNKKDIVTDLNARFFETADGKAHRGFSLAFQSVETSIRATLTKLKIKHPNLQLFITGHSLGAALATVASHSLERDFLISACYTFGSPRVGNADWSESVKTPVYRVVNGADGVPLVPGGIVLRTIAIWLPNLPFLTWLKGPVEKFTKSGFVGFQHAGDLRFLSNGAEDPVLIIGSAAAWSRLRYLVVGKFFAAIKSLNPKFLSATFSDHSISAYIANLRVVAKDRNIPIDLKESK
ncbi:MAG: lipase family protein [Sneathiella sp.]